MDEKQRLANSFYDTMVYNYARHTRGGVDAHSSYGKFVNAAIALAQLQMPNPFKLEETQDAAEVKPTKPGQKITGVVRK